MDELAAGLSRITFGPEVANAYEQAFNKIVLFAENVRGPGIPLDELVVTRTLAGPFTTGGLLILLTEPRSYHPWDKGIDHVIATCNSLDSLNEGIQIGSKGHLSFKDDVSVLDLRPFLPKKLHPTLRDSEWEALYDLVFSAIEAKKTEVLLCMGVVCKIPELHLQRKRAKRF
ncbi:hypothetical protein EDB81DRAFT_703337 [Dactylonectria macrodidyma]|uniref:Uncharacterized protein n=1 Tax=Dactylonectria macrodidyma TaxID=307937 RepID=A0A9P9D2P7_9HYPO|nr:hypothetical protein EDB81DRAFT_703337 [Dactylonectria macrodidyma]